MSDDPFARTPEEEARQRDARRRRLFLSLLPLVFITLFAIVAVAVFSPLLEPEPRRLVVPPPQQSSNIPRPGPPIAASDPRLNTAFGTGVVAVAGQEARRLGAIAARAHGCNLRDARWLMDLRGAIGPFIARRYNSYEGRPEDAQLLARHVATQFAAGLDRAGQEAPPPCEDLPAWPELRAMDSLLAAARAGPAR
jgi:hypothetical protein